MGWFNFDRLKGGYGYGPIFAFVFNPLLQTDQAEQLTVSLSDLGEPH
jgi:hypothetical protein